ncbi:MAG: hypothetical protein ACQER2_06440 [Bacillota bacterium]
MKEKKRQWWLVVITSVMIIGVVFTYFLNNDRAEDVTDEPMSETEETDETTDEENDQDESTNGEEGVESVIRPSIEDVQPLSDSLTADQTVTVKIDGKEVTNTYTAYDFERIPLETYVPIDATVKEEAISVRDVDIERAIIDDHLYVDYFGSEANETDVEKVMEDTFSQYNVTTDDLEVVEAADYPKMFPEREQLEFYDTGYTVFKVEETYGDIYYGKLHGRYVLIHSYGSIDNQEVKLTEAVFQYFLLPDVPAIVYGNEEVRDEETGRWDNVTLTYYMDAGVAEETFQLFKENQLNMTSYIPADFSHEETKKDSVTVHTFTDEEPSGHVALGVFDQGITESEAISYINDYLIAGDNTSTHTKDEAVQSFSYMNGAEDTASIDLIKHQDRYYYLETYGEQAESAHFRYGSVAGLITAFLRYEDTEELLIE